MSRLLLTVLVAVVVVGALNWRGVSNTEPPQAEAQGAQLRIVLPMVSHDVLPDLVIEAITVTRAEVNDATYRYRILNAGDAPADLARFTMQAWFSANDALEKGVDIEAGIVGFSVILAPGSVLEAEAVAKAAGDSSVQSHPYLILELDSAGSVVESNSNNNSRSTRRPPLDLVTAVQLSWDDVAKTATVTWTFRGEIYGIADGGFRVETPGFGIQEVPAGTRSVVVPFNQVSGERPCVARVAALRPGAQPWPTVESNRLCQ